jgi:peptide-methionine (S)-S-oxide reductase
MKKGFRMSAIEQATFGAGCFWGAEAAYRSLSGVIDTRVGFASQAGDNAVRIEVVQIDFAPAQVPFSALIEHFWGLHDPTSVDRQGEYSGVKYRSAIFVASAEQEAVARDVLLRVQTSGRFARPIATVIQPLGHFELASDDDQRYIERHGLSTCALGS